MVRAHQHAAGAAPAINFDNAATTPPFTTVLREIMNFAPWYSSVHRGTGYKSQLSSEIYDKSRKIVLDFIGGDENSNTVIYVKNTTEAINKLANRICSKQQRCIVLSTDMEHHSNDLPWRNKFRVKYIEIDSNGRLSIEDLERKLKKYEGDVKLLTITGASNVTGYINPIYKAAELAHRYGAKILVDGAQLVPHCPVDIKSQKSPDHIDFLAFSAHKMYAPFGVGVLVGPTECFEKGDPDYSGGGTVKLVTHDYVRWDTPPQKEEAGTQNLMGIVALITSIGTLKTIGMKRIEDHERELLEYAALRMSGMDGMKFYGECTNTRERVSIIPFNIEGMQHETTAKILSFEGGIAVRSGCFCAQPYIQKLLKLSSRDIDLYRKNEKIPRAGMVRLSFGLYNEFSEIDRLVECLKRIVRNRDYYISKYEGMDFSLIHRNGELGFE